MCPAFPGSSLEAGSLPAGRSILQQFLGETLYYHIGFWLFPHCGEAKTGLFETENAGIFRASMEGRTSGLVDLLLGHYRYSYISLLSFIPEQDRFRPLRFELTKEYSGKQSRRSVVFDHPRGELLFSETDRSGTTKNKQEPMREGIVYEDYLTLFYNFRHGSYGPLERGKTYHLPLYIDEGMNSIDLAVFSREEEEKARKKENSRANKAYLVRFTVHKEDVSSKSGVIFGWLDKEAVPVKGTIKDVIFLGDLWGDLVSRKVISVSS
jgi:hypothetical protein